MADLEGTGLTDNDSKMTPDDKAEQTRERLRVSADWMRLNFWEEWAEAYQSYKCRTNPIIDPKTKKEDLTRTNVAMPDMFIAVRKKSVRMSRRPPTIRVHANDEQVAQQLSHYAMYQWDRADEQRYQRKHVMQGEIFGISLKIHWWDAINRARKFRYAIDKALDRIYASVDEATGIVVGAQEGDEGAIRADKLNEDQQAQLAGSMGPEVSLPSQITRFEGPVSTLPFIGDWYPEPELDGLHTSAWHIFEEVKDAEWVAYFGKQTYVDPETGEEKTVFDPKAIEELLEAAPYDPRQKDVNKGSADFKQRLRDVIFKDRPLVDVKLIPGRRFLIHREFTFRKGLCWVRYLGNRTVFLGEYPLPFDLDGRYPLSSFIPIEDLFCLIGDSTPRLGKHLWRMHNVTVAQRTDLVTNAMKPTLVIGLDEDLPAEAMDTGLFRVVRVSNPRALINSNLFANVQVPTAAWQSEAQIMRLLQMLEPSINDYGPESQATPNSSKVATLGILQQQTQDSLGSDELEALNQAIADETEIKLWMFQEMQDQELDISSYQDRKPKDYLWSVQTGGGSEKPRKICLKPLELQQDFEVFPELGSTLALDDQLRRKDATMVYQTALQAPEIWDVREAARRLARTFVGVGGESLVKPEPAPAPPPSPEIKMSASLAIKWAELSGNLQQQFEKLLGFTPDPGADMTDIANHIIHASEAAKAAKEMIAPPEETQPPPPNGKPPQVTQ